jgi:hypothetical protein
VTDHDEEREVEATVGVLRDTLYTPGMKTAAPLVIATPPEGVTIA